MKVVDYIKMNDLAKLNAVHGVIVKEYDDLVVLNYNQIESPVNDITNECRGLILEKGTWKVVSRAFDRFFNYGERQDQPMIDLQTASIFQKLDGCFTAKTKITCWDGSTVNIIDIVNNGARPVLLGLDEKGKPIPSYIEEVKNHGKKDLWFEVTIDCPVNEANGNRYSGNKMQVTPNHEVKTQRGFVAVSDLLLTDKLIRPIETVDATTLNFIKASLLGDGCIVRTGKNKAYFTVGHTDKNSNYLKWKYNCLEGISNKIETRTSGYGSIINRFKTKNYTSLLKIKEEWYGDDGKKRLPSNLDWMDDLSVAIWYMDDGSLAHNENQKDRCNFSTHAFSLQDNERLAEKLRDMYGVEVVIQETTKGYFLRVNRGKDNSINNFFAKISKYITEDMQYKLPDEYRGRSINFTFKAKKEYTTQEVAILNIKQLDLTKKNFPHGRQAFDIQTTTKNYVANGVCVHNSLIKIYNYKNVWYISTRGTAFAESEVNGWNITFKDLVLKAINGGIKDEQFQRYCDQHLDTQNTYICEVTAMENRVVTRYTGYNLALLAIRNNSTGEYQKIDKNFERQISRALISRPKEFKFKSFEECVASAKELPDLEEGYVVYVDGVPTVKIKSPQYLLCHHIKGEGLNPKRIMQLVLMNEQEEYLAYFPEDRNHFVPYIVALDQLLSEIESCYTLYRDIESQKDFALAVKDNTFSAALFMARAKKLDPIHCFSLQREQYKMDVLTNFMKEQGYA